MEVRSYACTYVNRIPLTSDPMPVALLSDPMIRIPLKVRVEYSCGSVEYTTACSTDLPHPRVEA